MATQVQVNRAGTFEDISYSDFQINLGTSKAQVAPTAKVTSQVRESIQAGQELRIRIDGTTRFEGVTQSAGKKDRTGQRTVEVEHDAVNLMEEPVSLSLSSPTVSSVLNAAVDAADGGAGYTVNTAIPQLTLSNDYNVDSRPLKRVFRDMVDRAEAIWWVEPTGEVINVEPPGDRGLWQSLDAQADRIRVDQFDEGDVKTVRNDVEVIGTGDVAVSATETNTNSISTYGRRTGESPYKVNYVTTQAEAGALAQALLQPDPLAQGKITVSQATGAVDVPQVNKTVDLADPSKDIDESGLAINEQVIRQSRAELSIGQGAQDAIARLNRNSKSEGDVTEPGSVYDTDRISDGAIEEQKLVDGSVITSKLADLAVELEKVSDGAIDTVKIRDDAIEAPKILANTITANEIATDTITANEIVAGTITALEIASSTITTNELDALDVSTQTLELTDSNGDGVEFKLSGSSVVLEPTASGSGGIGSDSNRYGLSFFDNLVSEFISVDVLSPDTGQVTNPVGFQLGTSAAVGDNYYLRPGEDNRNFVGTSAFAYQEMHAHNFVTASPDPIDGVDPECICETDWYENPPEEVRQRARDIGDTDDEVPEGRDHTPVELGTMANWLLEALKASNERINDLEERIERLESQI